MDASAPYATAPPMLFIPIHRDSLQVTVLERITVSAVRKERHCPVFADNVALLKHAFLHFSTFKIEDDCPLHSIKGAAAHVNMFGQSSCSTTAFAASCVWNWTRFYWGRGCGGGVFLFPIRFYMLGCSRWLAPPLITVSVHISQHKEGGKAVGSLHLCYHTSVHE